MEAHEILGVPKDATEEQVRAAYKALALEWHPDRQPQNGEQATSKFVEINRAHKTMLRTLARGHRTAKATQRLSTSEPLPSSSPTPASLFASLNRPTHPMTSRKTPSSSPTSSRSASSSSTHSSQPSRSSSQSRDDTPCTSTPSVNRDSTPISPSDPFNNPKDPAPQTEALHKVSNTCDFNTETFLQSPDGSREACESDFIAVTLRPERSILRADAPKRWIHVLNITLEEIYQGKTFRFRLVRYKLSGEQSIVPLDVTVPVGSRDGTEVIVTNVGNERKDGTRQNIVFFVRTMKHKHFSRVHDDLLLEVRLPWVDSLIEKEGDVRVKGIDGNEYAFPVSFCKTGLLSGTTIIPNAGMPYCVGDGRGRIVVRWKISSSLSTWDALKHAFKFKP